MSAFNLLILLFFFPLFPFAQDCEEVKTGRFKITDEESGITCLVRRRRKVQIEKFANYKTKYRVEWLNNCTFKITIIKTNIPEKAFQKGVYSIVRITKIREESYDVIISSNFSARKFNQTFLRIE